MPRLEDYFTNISDTPIQYHDEETVSALKYKSTDIFKIFRTARGVINKMFEKTNEVHVIITQLYYSRDVDKFILPIKIKNEADESKVDVYGVEFTYNKDVRDKIRLNNDLLILLEHYETDDDIAESLVEDYPDITQLIGASTA